MDVRIPLRARRERGAVAVEFALVSLPLLMLLMGIIQYGLYFWGMQAGTSAAADAVRQLSVGNCLTSAQLHQYLGDRLDLPAGDDSSITGDVTYRTADAVATGQPVVGGNVDVKVTFDAIDLHLPLIPLPNDGQVIRDADARVEDDASEGCAP